VDGAPDSAAPWQPRAAVWLLNTRLEIDRAPPPPRTRVCYAGKELIENLTVLRFGNRVFEPLWSRQYIRNVQVGGGGSGA
jgi:hypothetical protein